MSKRTEKNSGPKGQTGRQATPTEVRRAFQAALAKARAEASELTARAHAHEREAVAITEQAVRLKSSLDCLAMKIGETVSVTLRPVGNDDRQSKRGSRRRNRRRLSRDRSLTQKVCNNLRTFGRYKRPCIA